MKLDQMIIREDFFKILKTTVKTYFKDVKGIDICFDFEKPKQSEPLIINGKFNFVARAPICRGLREFLKNEYNIRGSKIKFFAGKLAVLLATVFPFIGKSGAAYISIGALGKNEFISPQNRSIRFFDYDKMTVDCIIKDGFTDKYFKNQINFRNTYNYDFLLPMTAFGDNWFREPIMQGNPLARVTDSSDYEKGISDAFAAIKTLANDTIKPANSVEYAKMLVEKIGSLLEIAKTRKNIKFADEMNKLAQSLFNFIAKNPFEISTAMSHGDFQSGNIWVDTNKKTWIYDWETADRRSIWYDAAVLGFSLRRPFGWAQFLAEKEPLAMFACDNRKNYSEAEKAAIKKIVLLEDIIFYLEDMLELPEDWGAAIFDGFCERILPLFGEN